MQHFVNVLFKIGGAVKKLRKNVKTTSKSSKQLAYIHV